VKQYDAVIREFADELTLAAKRELGAQRIGKNGRYGVATRDLQKSLTYSIGGGKLKFGSPLPYAAFIHWGVNGTERNRNAPYSYRFSSGCQTSQCVCVIAVADLLVRHLQQ